MLNVVISAIGCLIMAALITFILVNVAVGCEDWSQPNCVRPLDFLPK